MKTINRSRTPVPDAAASYNAVKDFQGQRYTGMRIGRAHKWYYDRGEWNEKKITPEQWEIEYAVTKRRAGKAPEGSGVPVGTEYHWYIVAHQAVTKLSANDYSTSMSGYKFKLAHKRADHERWSASANAQRVHLIKIFQQLLRELQNQRDAAGGEHPVAAKRKGTTRRHGKARRLAA
jgi:hypothetical protein